MAADLPSEFDFIVLGTGMPESILAAACSRIGQSVLHIDRNEYYSGDWASFNLNGIQKWANEQSNPSGEGDLQPANISKPGLVEEGETVIPLPVAASNISQVHLNFHVPEAPEVNVSNNASNSQFVSEISCNSMEQTGSSNITSETACADGEKHSEERSEEGENKPGSDNEGHEKCDLEESIQKLTVSEKCEIQTAEDTDKTVCPERTSEPEVVQAAGSIEPDEKQEVEASEAAKGQEGDGNESMEEKSDSLLKVWTATDLKKEWRRFNLDLSPKVLYCGGSMVELLISSDIAKYCEFKTVTRVLTQLKGKLEKVPCSRADVFSSKQVSMIEKRMLMKFLTFCMEQEKHQDQVKDFLDKPFIEFLQSHKLSSNVKHFVQHSIAMATANTNTEDGLAKTKKFLMSLGRYGNTAFLWSLYGSGELPQSFCRMCAVFGGVYCLRMTASHVIMDNDNRVKAVVTTEGQRIKCRWLLMENTYAPAKFLPDPEDRYIARCIMVIDRTILAAESQQLSMMCIPCCDDPNRPIHLLELPPSSMACPDTTYVIHLSRQCGPADSPQTSLTSAVDSLFWSEGDGDGSERPRILWSLYFKQQDRSCISPSNSLPENVIILPGPGMEVDIDNPVQQAKQIFEKILPGEEFLPKAPNPEDIIYVDDEEASVTENNQSEFSESAQITENQSEFSVKKESDVTPSKDQSDSCSDEKHFKNSEQENQTLGSVVPDQSESSKDDQAESDTKDK